MTVCGSGCAAVHRGAGSSNEGCAGRHTIGRIAKGRRGHAGEAEAGNRSEVSRLWTEPVNTHTHLNTRQTQTHILLNLQIILKGPDTVNHVFLQWGDRHSHTSVQRHGGAGAHPEQEVQYVPAAPALPVTAQRDGVQVYKGTITEL